MLQVVLQPVGDGAEGGAAGIERGVAAGRGSAGKEPASLTGRRRAKLQRAARGSKRICEAVPSFAVKLQVETLHQFLRQHRSEFLADGSIVRGSRPQP